MRPEVCEVVTAQRCEPGLGDRGWARVAVAAAAAGLGGGRSADADSFLSPPPPVSGGSGRCYVRAAILDFTLQFFFRGDIFLVI